MGRQDGIQSEKEAGLVMGTNGSSIVSKRSVERLYLPEPHFFRYFVKKPQRRSPLINRGYWLRMYAIEHSVRQFLTRSPERPKLVLNFGCGYDPLPFQFLSREPELCANARFIDIDHHKLILEKCNAIRANEALRNTVPDAELVAGGDSGGVIMRGSQYLTIGCDLGDLQALGSALRSEIDTTKFSIICTAEVSLTYMDVKAADAVINWASRLSDDVEFCLLEQHFPDGPDHPFAKTMMKHFSKLGTPLYSIRNYPTMSQQEQRFIQNNWAHAKARSLWDLWSDSEFLSGELRKSLDTFEAFDEWEELALFASHYFLLRATTRADKTHQDTALSTVESNTDNREVDDQVKDFKLIANITPRFNGHRRFGSTLQGRSGTVGIHGGLGRQTRLSSTDFYAVSDNPKVSDGGPSESIPSRMCHTITQLKGGGCLLAGGRASPTTVFNDCWLNKKGNWKQVQNLPTPWFRHCAIRVALEGGDEYVLFYGGKTNKGNVLGQFTLWNESGGFQQIDVVGQSPRSRFGATLACLDTESGILCGGMSESGEVLDDFWTWRLSMGDDEKPIITLTNYTEQFKAATGDCFRWIGRFGASISQVEDNLVLVGGISGSGFVPERYEIMRLGIGGLIDLETGKSSCSPILSSRRAVEFQGSRPLLAGHSAIPVGHRKLLIVGGGAVCFSFGVCWNEGTWLLTETNTSDDTNDWRLIQPSSNTETTTPVPTAPSPTLVGSEMPVMTSIPHIKIASSQDFDTIVEAARPVIIEGLDIGNCCELWSKEYLKKAVGSERKVTIHDSTADHMDFQNKNFSYVPKEFGTFIDEVYGGSRQYLRSVSSEKPLQRPANLTLDFPGLKNDFQLPPELRRVSENAHSSPLRISGPVILWLHYDVMANVLCQIRGEKTLILYPPWDVSRLGLAPGSSSSSINVFQKESSDEGSDTPNSPAGTHPHEARMKPGDILFIPPLWLHTARPKHEDGAVSVAVNVFFRNLAEGYASGRDVYGNRDLQAYEQGRKDVEKIARAFEQLPRDAARFYLDRLADEMRAKGRL